MNTRRARHELNAKRDHHELGDARLGCKSKRRGDRLSGLLGSAVSFLHKLGGRRNEHASDNHGGWADELLHRDRFDYERRKRLVERSPLALIQ